MFPCENFFLIQINRCIHIDTFKDQFHLLRVRIRLVKKLLFVDNPSITTYGLFIQIFCIIDHPVMGKIYRRPGRILK